MVKQKESKEKAQEIKKNGDKHQFVEILKHAKKINNKSVRQGVEAIGKVIRCNKSRTKYKPFWFLENVNPYSYYYFGNIGPCNQWDKSNRETDRLHSKRKYPC